MKKFISDVSLLDLIPFNFKGNEETENILKTIDFILRERFIKKIPEVILMDRIDKLEEWKVDELALDLHVDYYKSDLPLKKKKELVKTSLLTHRTKGTPFALEVITTILFERGEVQEWFEYDGDPYKFRISTLDSVTDPESLKEIIESIFAVKNVRSWLDSIAMLRYIDFGLKYGLFLIERKRHDINIRLGVFHDKIYGDLNANQYKEIGKINNINIGLEVSSLNNEIKLNSNVYQAHKAKLNYINLAIKPIDLNKDIKANKNIYQAHHAKISSIDLYLKANTLEALKQNTGAYKHIAKINYIKGE